MKYSNYLIIGTLLFSAMTAEAQKTEKIKYGDFNSWITRNIHESSVIGGKTKKVYEVGPARTIDGNKAYINEGGSPWGTSNVYAKVAGVVKASNAVEPCIRSGHDLCAKLMSKLEHVKVIGLINMDVMVAGSMFLGQMIEPISSTKNPYSKMDMGIAYTKRPKNLVLDYKVDMPDTNIRTKATGFSSQKTLQGHDDAVVFIMLQRRWEKFTKDTKWVNGHKIPIVYGDASNHPELSWVGLRNNSNAYYARNSKGKLRPVVEEGYDSPDATPTHAIVMISAGSGEPYVGTEGLNFYVDNVAFEF